MTRILVTGHLGFIGSYLMPRLGANYAIDLKNGKDILDCDLPDADIVIHLAAEPGVVDSVKDPFHNAMTNILGTIRLAERYKESKFIFASSGGTIQETIESPYGLSKKTGEEYIKLLCDDYVILRFPNVYGPGSRSVVDKFLREDRPIIYGDGSSTRIYGHVDDVVQGILLSMHWPQGTYKLGSDQNYSVLQIADAVGKPVRFKPERKGEITHSRSELPNETPNWKPNINLMEYIHAVSSNS